MWPTPATQTQEGGLTFYGGTGGRDALDRTIGPAERKALSAKLNPDWVETLMGYPVGWTDFECDEPESVPWPAPPGAHPRSAKWATPDVNSGRRNVPEGTSMFGVTPDGRNVQMGLETQAQNSLNQYPWEPPRVTDRKEHRRPRLTSLGNAIVPLCAYHVLTTWLAEREAGSA
jgi:hypothetical protein